ncbi:uncharacterized protein LOC116300312, partial [Actinia tenebrosa]|uniref:Uncharacterized protein LOC116300312 n=1 Tax=Actinia tenebrosa TaxID=6105 RepID=A0A6P8IE93_ACTTE
FGFFPLWIKINYNFHEFSKRRAEIFNTLKKVFAIPQTDDSPAREYMVYMGISLGKRDVLICVLVPQCVRQNIRTSLQYEDTSIQLRRAHVTGIYFSRIKNKNYISWSQKNKLTGSDLSISSAMSSDFGELCDPAYEDMNNNDIATRNVVHHSYQDYQPRGLAKDENFNDIQNEILHTKRERYEASIPHNDSENKDFRYQGNESVSSVRPYGGSDQSANIDSRCQDNRIVSSLRPFEEDSSNMNSRSEGSHSVSSVRPYNEDDSSNMNSRSQGNYSVSSVRTYREGVNTNTGPKLVRANYGYISASPKLDSTSAASEESEKLSYGAFFFVDKNSSPKKVYSKNREARSVESNDSDQFEPPDASSPFPTNDGPGSNSGHYGDAIYPAREYNLARETPKSYEEGIKYSQRSEIDVLRPNSDLDNGAPRESLTRESPRSDQEDILFSRKTEFSFEKPTLFDSDHERELLYWSRNVSQNEQETDEHPSLWYQPRLTTEISYDRNPQNQLEHAYGRSPLSSSDAQRDVQERKPNLLKKHLQGNDLRPVGYWQGDEQGSSSHGDDVGYHRNEQVQSNFTSYRIPDKLEDRRGLSYQGYSVGRYSDGECPSNHTGYHDDHNQRLSYYEDSFHYYGNEQVASNHADMSFSNHRCDEDQRPSYYGNDWTSHESYMEAEPEPEPSPVTSRLSLEERNGQAAVRQSTPSSSSSGFFTADQSVVLRSDKISRSMPSLHAKQHDDMLSTPQPRWSDSRRSNNGNHSDYRTNMSKYESEAVLEDNVFVDIHKNSVRFKAAPQYCSPPDYQEAMIRKSYLSLSSVSLDSKRMKAKSPLLSSQSVTSIYKEKEALLSREELQESIRSAEEKQWEILLKKSKEFLIAAKMGAEEEVRNLLEEDVDVDYKNEFGHTALMVASREGHLEVIHVLIDHGANMNIQDKYGKSALHEAAWSGKHQVINALLSNEAEMNCVDEEGRTPLQYASLRGKTKVVEVLLQFGAEDSILNKDGESAVEIAYRCRHKDIVKLLLKSTDKKTRKNMKAKIRKQRIQRLTTATSLPNLTKATSLKTLRRSRSKPDVNKKGTCVIQ